MAARPKALVDENGRLKTLLADAMLDNSALKDLLGEKWCRPRRSSKRSRLSQSAMGCAMPLPGRRLRSNWS